MDCPACGTSRSEMAAARFCPTCGAELPPDVDPLIGKVVGGRFRITGLIAEGGMGRVYAAEQKMGTTLRRVAIKTLLAEFSKSEPQVARFRRECSTVSELEHPNTIKFYDYGKTDEGELFIAMEFVDGESLASVERRLGQLTPERVDVIVGQICGSLQEAHDKGIIHRDVKPENVLLTSPAGEEDFVKVLDFGIAKRATGESQKLTPLGLVLGSPAYMSPEQFMTGHIDHRSDIYSLAVLAYEALTGQLPYDAREIMDWPVLHRHAEPLPFDPAGADVRLSMRRAILRGLSKRADDRQASMREFFTDFTLGTPRRSSLTSGRPPPGDEQPTLIKQPSAPPPAVRSIPPGGSIPPPGSAPLTQPPIASHPIAMELGGIPATVREPVPPTVRQPQRRLPLLVLGMLIALALGGAVAAVLLRHPKEPDDEQLVPHPTAAPKASAIIAPERDPKR